VIPVLLRWLRAAGLVGQAVALGGSVFAVVVLRRAPGSPPARALGTTLAITGAGGAGVLLIAHVHELNDSKSAFVMELSHLLLGLTSLVAGWARWPELRLPSPASAGPGRLWGPAFAVFGLLLLLYRER
jgi:hypothetical protein